MGEAKKMPIYLRWFFTASFAILIYLTFCYIYLRVQVAS